MGGADTVTVCPHARSDLDIAISGHIDALLAGNEADCRRGAGLEAAPTELNTDRPGVAVDESGGVIANWT